MIPGPFWAEYYSRGKAQTITQDGFQVGVTEPSIYESYYYFLRCSPGWTGAHCVDQATFKLKCLPNAGVRRINHHTQHLRVLVTSLEGDRQRGVCVCVQLFCFPQITFAKLQN